MERKNQRIRLAIVDDHLISGLGTKALLSGSSRIQINAVFNKPQEALNYLTNSHLDVLIVDAYMPEMDGFELLAQVKEKYPKVKVVMLTVSDEKSDVLKAFANNADGYVLKDVSKDELLDLVFEASTGKKVICQRLIPSIIEDIITYAKTVYNIPVKNSLPESSEHPPYKKEGWNDPYDVLTHRELEILQYIGKGLSTKEISMKLNISSFTVSTHRKNIYSKLGVENLQSLIRIGKRMVGN